ncbi:leucine-rich repeat and guanylate kinase domain-containing protein isoform X1 [Diceros bicornis minor]|uniref:leucine-rich repeat and guanylate kinase domain-containing protein isoform X1 n=1 Tax=Diceros bicornis minor TaxID=77932 RepID=UPI0026ED8AFC|nr:leucine-rich repeat and guanylate kinase domain-containing protein isoform X1 [Diceros bicornis minor]
MPSSLQGGLGGSRTEAQSILLRSEKDRQSCWSFIPMGQRPKGTIRKASSYLLRQLVRRYQESDADGEEDEDEGEGEGEREVESEESSESEMLNLQEEFDGVLREEVVAEALHQLGRSGPGTEQVYLSLTLSGCDLIDVSILCGYVHLQKLDLSVNKIGDLSCVSCMPYLLELNASQNKLTTFFDFKPPKNLKKVDFSCNQISELCDLSAYQALTKLILDSNEIEEISGLELCSSLTHLSLAKNKITTINGLGMLPIKILCLSNNQIEKITGLEDLKALQIVDLSHNQIRSLQGLENHDFLEVINLEDNKIAELGEIEYIENLPLLRVLNLLRNPIQEKSEYWFFVIFMLLRLTELDQKKIQVEEKVAAVNKYDPPPEVVAAQDHLTHVVNSVMQPQRIFDSTLPSLDAPYPMLILAGPQACGKRELAHRLCRQFNSYFRYGACHTTRPPYFGEGDRVDYHFISQEVFDEMLNMGKFILTFNYGNHNYGLSRDTVEGIARDGLASCIHMEIEGVRSLKCSSFEPRYILVVPMNKKKYEGYLRRKGLFSRVEIEFAVSRVDLYVKVNQKFPGYFDAVINADDLDVAYQTLSQLVREYLGLSEEAAKGLAPTAGAPPSKKTPSGVPAHLVPSPRRLAKLQADGQITEHLSGMQIHAKISENQNLAPSQNQEVAQEGATHQKELSPNSQVNAEPLPQPSSSALCIPQQAQDLSPNQKEGDAQESDLSSKIITTNLPENEARTPEVKAGEVGQPSSSPSQGPPQHSDPPPAHSPQPDQDEESGEAKVTPSEPPQGPCPASLSPQRAQDEETESASLPPNSSHHDPLRDPPLPEGAKALGPSLGDSQQPLEVGASKEEVVRVSTPFPALPQHQDSTNTKQTQNKEDPMTLLPRSRLAPTRLPQPRVLAPLQSRRPTPKLLSPSREEALGTASHQTMTPSPRPLPAQEGDPSKLPPISPPHSKPPQNLSSHPDYSPQQVQEKKAREVKLPHISPPVQEHAPQPAPDPPQEEEAQVVRLPHIPTPFAKQQLPENTGAGHDSRPAKERQALKAGRSSSEKIPDLRVSPQNQEPVQQMGARKKKLPSQRETAKGPAPLKKAPPGSRQTALQPESQSRPTAPQVPDHPNPSPPQSPEGNQRRKVPTPEVPEPPHAEPLPEDPQLQEEKRENVHYSRKKTHTKPPSNDLVQKVALSKKGPSLKTENSGGLSQEITTTLSGDQPTQEGHPPHRRPLESEKASAESVVDGSAPGEHPRRGEQVHKRGRSQKNKTALDPPEQDGVAPTQQPVKETQAHKGTSQTRESSVQRDNASRQQTKEKHTQKHGGVPQDKSSAAPQNQVSNEEQGTWKRRLRARGSQSTKV